MSIDNEQKWYQKGLNGDYDRPDIDDYRACNANDAGREARRQEKWLESELKRIEESTKKHSGES